MSEPRVGNAAIFCGLCGEAHPSAEVIALAGAMVCANCKPSFIRKLQEAAPSSDEFTYKGLWFRWLAKVLDVAFIYVMFLIVAVVLALILPHVARPTRNWNPVASNFFGAAILVFYIAIVVGYNTWMIGRFGTTLGKLAIKRAFARSLMELVNLFTLHIGSLMAAFDKHKRGLHDRVAGTVVVAKS